MGNGNGNGAQRLSREELIRYARVGLEIEQQRLTEQVEQLNALATAPPIGRPRKTAETGAVPGEATPRTYGMSRKARREASERMKKRWADWRKAKGRVPRPTAPRP